MTHTHTRSEWLSWMRGRPVACASLYLCNTNNRHPCPGDSRTGNASQRQAADLRVPDSRTGNPSQRQAADLRVPDGRTGNASQRQAADLRVRPVGSLSRTCTSVNFTNHVPVTHFPVSLQCSNYNYKIIHHLLTFPTILLLMTAKPS